MTDRKGGCVFRRKYQSPAILECRDLDACAEMEVIVGVQQSVVGSQREVKSVLAPTINRERPVIISKISGSIGRHLRRYRKVNVVAPPS